MELLQKAQELGLDVVGLTFHVGTQVFSSDMHVYAIQKSLELFEEAKTIGFNFTHLDIGGGFPISYENLTGELDIFEFCTPIRAQLEKLPPHV